MNLVLCPTFKGVDCRGKAPFYISSKYQLGLLEPFYSDLFDLPYL